MNTYEPVTLKLSKDEALVLTNSLIDMKNYYMNDSRQHDGMAQPYIDLLKDLSAIKNNDNKITLVGGGLECAEYALRHTDNGKANPDISDRLINRMNGMAVREDFSYDINKNSSQYVCRVYYKDNPVHAFSGAVHRGRIDMNALTQNVEATINMKMSQINNASVMEHDEQSEDGKTTGEKESMNESRSQLADMMINEIIEKTEAIINNEDRMFDIKVGNYTIEGMGLTSLDNSGQYIEYRLWNGGIESKYDNFDYGEDIREKAEAFIDSIADEIGLTIPENGILVGRPVEGISLNGDEFLLDNKGNPLVFNSIEQAKDFLIIKGGYDEVSLEEINFYDANEELKKWDKSKNNDSEGKKKPSKEHKSDVER